MSWLFSQALVGEYSEATSSDGEPSAQLNVISTPHPFWLKDKMTDVSRLSRFGVTYQHLTADRGEELLTLFRGGFHARTSPPPEKAQESTESEADSGQKWRGLSVKYDRDSSSWKTHHCLFPEDLPWSSVTLPRWGMMRDGELWERTTQEPLTSVTGVGLWRTPQAWNGQQGPKSETLARKAQKTGCNAITLTDQVRHPFMWPSGGGSTRQTWATPTASTGGPEPEGETGRKLTTQVGGQLNPEWVEWLMAWPIAWTDLEPLATDRFRRWQNLHGKY